MSKTTQRSGRRYPRTRLAVAVAAGAGWLLPLAMPPAPALAAPAQAATSADDAKAMEKLKAGRKAFSEKNYSAAADRFKEFVTAYSTHAEAASAYYGLGLSKLQAPQGDNAAAAADALRHAASDKEFADRPLALYYQGVALRNLGIHASVDAANKPNEAEALNRTASQKFDESSQAFIAAQSAFADRAKAAPASPTPGEDAEWSARARCDAADALLRSGKYNEAADLSAPFQSDAALAHSKYRALGLYHLGHALFAQHQNLAAGRALSQLAPFDQEFGPHAHYLLGRIHDLAEERPEAAAQYKAAIEGFEKQKKSPPQGEVSPERKAAFEALANGREPEFVTRAKFYSAVLQYDEGRYAEAAERLAPLVQQQPKGALAREARLRLGYCYLQGRKLNEAVQALDPLKDDKEFADRALWWSARAKQQNADANNPQAVEQAQKASIDPLRRAADKAREMAATDPGAKSRRAEILMDVADAQQLTKQYREAAATYQQILAEDAKTGRAEEAMERRVTALQLAGQLKESDEAGEQFKHTFPKSTLLPAVLFRQAENAYLDAAAAMDAKSGKAKPEQDKLLAEAAARYKPFIERYPEFEYIDQARQALATCYYHAGKYADAVDLLVKIPETGRTGELATVPYLQADCLIRQFPQQTDDALSAERLIQAAEDATKLLDSFVTAQPKHARTADALLKLGYCYQRMAAQLAIADERSKILAKAKEAYDKSDQQFHDDPSNPSVVLERARCLVALGDTGNAQGQLERFQNDPLRKSPDAPLALVRLSSLLRAQGRAQNAVDLMKHARELFESSLAADPKRAGWVATLKYEHALALQDAKKLPEARELLQQVVQQFADRPEAVNAMWRLAQGRREEAAAKLAEAAPVAARSSVAPADIAAAYAHTEEEMRQLSAAAELLKGQADAQSAKAATAEPTLRMLYELAWCYRTLGDAEADGAKLKLQQEAIERVRAHWPKDAPGAGSGSTPPFLGAPDVTPDKLPVQPSEAQARAFYQRLIFAGPATVLGAQARLEMSELLCRRGGVDPALDLLAAALEYQPPPELTQRIKLRVAAAMLAKENPNAALAQAKSVLAVKDSPVLAEARYLVGAAYAQQQDWPKAIETLAPFRDQDPWRNAQSIADRALLELGHAYAMKGDWEPSRQAYEALVNRYGQSPLVDEARFGMAWSLQNQKRYDEAVNAYGEVTRRTAAEPAARAMLNAGICRLEQKRPVDALKALLVVPATYGDYPDCGANALYEAGRAHLDDKKPQEAAACLRRVAAEYPQSKWAPLAQQRLAEIK